MRIYFPDLVSVLQGQLILCDNCTIMTYWAILKWLALYAYLWRTNNFVAYTDAAVMSHLGNLYQPTNLSGMLSTFFTLKKRYARHVCNFTRRHFCIFLLVLIISLLNVDTSVTHQPWMTISFIFFHPIQFAKRIDRYKYTTFNFFQHLYIIVCPILSNVWTDVLTQYICQSKENGREG